jgi:translocation and assembly module TamB
MKARSFRHSAGGRPRRGVVFSLAALAVLLGGVWLLPGVLVLTDLRDRPLQAAFAGIAGTATSRSATWNWLGGIEYRDVVLADRTGRAVVAVPRIVIERGLAALVLDPRDLGTVRLVGGDAFVEVRPGGSTIEDLLAPWLATLAEPTGAAVSFELEVLDGAIELVDLTRRDAWRVTDLAGAGRVIHGNAAAGWAMSGRVLHAGEPLRDRAAPASAPDKGPVRLDRATIAAAATATLARDGGWTVSAAPGAAGEACRPIAVAATRVPLGISSVWATRFMAPYLADGLADVRLDMAVPIAGAPPVVAAAAADRQRVPWQIAGTVGVRQFALCAADTLAELFVVEQCEAPLDLAFDGVSLSIRTFKASSPLFKAEASGRIGLPMQGAWAWGDALLADNFAIAASVDLAAASRSTPGGLEVREDVEVTGGQLELTASARSDGSDRVLELQASARDLAAVQGERPLRWNQPFSAWLRGRRRSAPDATFEIEEAKITSSAVELSASGNAEALAIQWTADLEKLVTEVAEVVDVAGMTLAGSARGRLDLEATGQPGASTARLSASLAQFACVLPHRAPWRDDEIVLEAEGSGSLVAGAAVVDACHAVMRSGDDSLELTQTGGALVNLAAFWPSRSSGAAARFLQPAPQSEGVSADVTVAGDLGRWQARLAALPGGWHADGWQFGGRLKGSAALAIKEEGWQVTRAGAEIEKLTASGAGRQIVEPRLVATGAGMVDPERGVCSISSAEVLTATMSLRTGGLVLRSTAMPAATLDRVRGKLQWQADVARFEKWLVPLATAEAWPAAGRAWGTLEVIDTPTGTNLLVDATGNQLTLARGRPSGGVERVWVEPRARLLVEVTRPSAAEGSDRLVVNRVSLDSATFAMAATGSVDDLSARQVATLAGTATYDWDLVSRLLTPVTGGRLRLTGAGSRPVMVRVPLDAVAEAFAPLWPAAGANQGGKRVASVKRPGDVPLPGDWLSAMRGRDDAPDAPRVAPVTLPVTSQAAPAAAWLGNLSAETSATWAAAEIDGFQIDPGAMDVRLYEGQLTFGPFDLAASGGRLRGAPWIKLLPLPGELVVPPGRVIDRVPLSGRFCEEWISWVTPLVGRSTHTQGVVSIDLAGARVPLADPFGGELAGQLIFENTEVTPGERLGPLTTLMVKLQTLVDPRFAFGDKVVLMRVRPEPVRMRLADRRLWHEGLVMEMGQLVVRSSGSVGADGTLAMAAEVSLRGDIAGSTPVVGQLLRTPLVIPLKGTVARPQFDARAIDQIVGRIVENTAEAVITDGLSRGLEQLFGNPPPAAPPP